MLYDVLTEFPALKTKYKKHKNAEQALRDTRRNISSIPRCGKPFGNG
jgi:hypothetical protein